MRNLQNTALSLALFAALLQGACTKPAAPPADASAEQTTAEEPAPAPLPEASANSENHFVEGVAGGVMTSMVEMVAEVVSVDQERREAVLRGPEGNELTVKIGENAVNLYQVKAGDRVNIAIGRELVIYVPDEEEKDEDGTTAVAAGAEKGDTPSGMIVATTKVTSKIKALDMEARTATLTFEDGSEKIFEVRPDVKMENYKVGQEVVFLITDMLAMQVSVE